MQINVCLACDDNYAKHAGVVIASILSNANVSDYLNFYILDGNISEENKSKLKSLKKIKDCNLEFITINESDFDSYKSLHNHEHLTVASFYRLKIASLLPQLERIIYLDCDVVINNSLSKLFELNIQDNVIAGVLDIDLKVKNTKDYINSGVLLIDLNKIREQNIEEEFFNYSKNNFENIQLGDQGIINDVLTGKIYILDETYNVQSECFIRLSSFVKKPIIVHYIGPKKTWHLNSWSIHRGLYIKYLQLTSWKMSIFDKCLWSVKSSFIAFITWFMHRPVFYFQKKFWKAVICFIGGIDAKS